MDLQKKRTSTLLSARSRQGSVSNKMCSTSCQKCVFCSHQKTSKEQQTYFPTMINKALYTKYSSSQNYYYTRGFNEFLTNARTSNVIKFKDILLFEEEEEYLKRFYKNSEYPAKLEMLTEYYKFHKDIARMFMLPSTNTVNRYHDKKRRLEYVRVTKMLRDQNQNPNQNHNKNPLQEMKKTDRIRNIPITDRVLDDLELTQTDSQGTNRRMVTEVSEKMKSGPLKKKAANKENNAQKETKKNKGIQEVKVNKDIRGGVSSPKKVIKKDKTVEHSRDLSISQTIQELNWKLGEIISSTTHSQNNLDILSYFENSEQQSNDTISNLQDFLEHIQANAQNTKLNKIPAISSSEQQSKDIKSLPNTFRSPDSDLRSTASSKTNLKINPYTDQISNNHKQLIPEANLAADLLRRVSLDHHVRPSKKMITTEDSTKHPEFERPLTTITSSRASLRPTSSANAIKSKNKPPVSIKIQNFEEALKTRQPTSPRQLNSQNSTSRERVCSKFSGSLSQRTNDIKSLKFNQDVHSRGVLTSRRESQTNSNLLKTSHRATSKKASFHNILEKNGDPSVHTSQNLTTRPSSHRDMRISLDMYPLNRHMSQPGGIENTITTTYTTDKTGSNYVKVRSTKTKSNMSGLQKVKEIKHLSTLGHMDLPDKDIRSVPTSACQKPSLRSHLTSRGEYRSSNKIEIIPEQDKHTAQRKALTHRETNVMPSHKYNKSEVKFGKLEAAAALMKKSSLPQSVVSRDAEQVFYEERRFTKDREPSPSKQGYTYNHNNIVNIFVQSRPETVSKETIQGSKEDLKRLGFGKSSTRKSDVFENTSKHVSGRESPSLMTKREDGTSAKIKNIYRSSIGTYAKPMLPTRTKGKVELDLMEKRIKVNDDNNYEILLKFKGK